MISPAAIAPPFVCGCSAKIWWPFRDTGGKVALITEACPHRGTSLFLGRNEEYGLRCVYHGWKFDVEGNCVDMPSEPTDSNFKQKIRAKCYPALERGGLIWTYMGPRSLM